MHGRACSADNPRAFRRTNGGNRFDMSGLWRPLKYERVYRRTQETGSQAVDAGWVIFYNHPQPDAAHGGQDPAVG
jgi:hypothetical protein